MKYLIVYAHPNPKSFCHTILETVSGKLKSAGNEIVVRDLYRLKFDPILGPDDFVALAKGGAASDVKKEQDHIIWAEKIVFIYPLWWGSVPAILKGYIDRVYSLGFAYKYVETGLCPLLKEKEVTIFTTQGGSASDYNKMGLYDAFQKTIDIVMFGTCGIRVLEHKYFSEVPRVSDKIRKDYLEEVKKLF